MINSQRPCNRCFNGWTYHEYAPGEYKQAVCRTCHGTGALYAVWLSVLIVLLPAILVLCTFYYLKGL